MTYTSRLLSATSLAVACLPQIVAAEVSVTDVWQNQKDYLATLGGELTTSVTRDGAVLSVADAALAYQLPFGVGSFTLSLPEFSMKENGDGAVGITYSDPISYGIAVDITGKGSFSAGIDLTMQGYSMIASGDPRDVTYTWSADRIDFQTRDIKIRVDEPGDLGLEDFTFSSKGSFADLSGVARVQVGTLVVASSSYDMGRQEITFNSEADNGRINYVTGSDSVSGQNKVSLPRTGMDILNLAAAIRDGLAIDATTSTLGYYTNQIAEENGTVISGQSSRARAQSMDYTLDLKGLGITGTVQDAEIDVQPGRDLPFPLRLGMIKGGVEVTLPLFASGDLQDFKYLVSIEGLEMAEELWALFDPGETLARDAVAMTVDFSGKVVNKLDWLDFLAVKPALDSGKMPVELHEVVMNTLLVEMAGARLTGNGSAVFDNSDPENAGDMPMPVGAVDLVLSGGNTLLNNLVAMGLLSEQDAMGARMAVAVFSKPDPEAGEDTLRFQLEINEQGHILANGQRLQ